MLPPKKTKRQIERPFQHSNGLFQSLATGSPLSDAAQPTMCSKFEPENAGEPGGATPDSNKAVPAEGGFFKMLHRPARYTILNPTSAARLVRARMSDRQEEVWVMALSAAKRLVGFEMIFRGTVDSCLVHPRDIVRFLCQTNASSYIVAHNHPSGDAEPSEHDWRFTHRLVSCGDLIEIPLLDHIVVTTKAHTSMASMRPEAFGRKVSEPSRGYKHPVFDRY